MIKASTSYSARSRLTFDKSWLWFSAALAILLLVLLIGPRITDDQQAKYCVVNVHLPGPFGIALNCNSPEYLRLATTPSALFEKDNTRQSRPGMILAAYVVSIPFLPLSNIPSLLGIKVNRADVDPNRINNALSQQFPAYIAYIVLNLLILYATFFYFHRICLEAAIDYAPAVQFMAGLAGFLIVTNDVVKVYFWTPHSQLFNVFVPVYAVYIFVRALDGAFLERNFAVLTGLTMGTGLTAYPLFVVAILSTFVAGLLSLAQAKIFAARVRWITNLGLFVAASAAPAFVWYVFVRLKTGGFYSHEFAQGPDVWIPAALSQGGLEFLVLKVANYFTYMIALAAEQAFPLAALLVLVGAIALKHPRAVTTTLRRHWAIAFAALIVSGGTAGFYCLAGDMHFRWAFATIPPLMIVAIVIILAVSQQLSTIEQQIIGSACLLTAVCQLAFTFLEDWPFS